MITGKKSRKNATEPVDLLKEKTLDPKYKTELCKSFQEHNHCPYGTKCRFAHGKLELFEKSEQIKNYKIKDCKSFFKEGFCLYGQRCLFKHGKNLQEIERSFFNSLLSLLRSEALACPQIYIDFTTDMDIESKNINLMKEQNKLRFQVQPVVLSTSLRKHKLFRKRLSVFDLVAPIDCTPRFQSNFDVLSSQMYQKDDFFNLFILKNKPKPDIRFSSPSKLAADNVRVINDVPKNDSITLHTNIKKLSLNDMASTSEGSPSI